MAPETSPTAKDSAVDPTAIRVPFRSYRLKLDEQGHLIPPTASEVAARAEAVSLMFVELANIPANPIEEDQAIYRAIDAERPDRPLFEGMY